MTPTRAQLTDRWRDYHRRRNIWVAHNFPDQGDDHPMLQSTEGIIEELGELAHANLKAKQNIRGNKEEHEAAARDAIGDMTVYLWGITGRVEPPLGPPIDEYFWALVDTCTLTTSLLTKLAQSVGKISAAVDVGGKPSVYDIAYLVAGMIAYCGVHGWDYHQIVDDTWCAVEKRDWIAFPYDGFHPTPVSPTSGSLPG